MTGGPPASLPGVDGNREELLARSDEIRRRRAEVIEHDEESGLAVYTAPVVIGHLEEPGGGWLAPDGRYYRCRDWEHLELARRLCLDFGWIKVRTRRRVNLADERLDRANWLRIWDNGQCFTDPAGLLRRTQAQLDVMFDLAQRHPSMRERLMSALRARREAEKDPSS
jgi:hypothetical protein